MRMLLDARAQVRRREISRYRFSAPPNWPPPPSSGWTPPPGWSPDPSWPTPPVGWQFWTLDPDGNTTRPSWRYSPRPLDRRRHAAISLAFAVLDLCLLVGAAIWTVTTSLLGHPLLGQAEFTIFFVPMFPVLGYAVANSAMTRRTGDKRSRRETPTPVEIIGALSRRARVVVGLGAAAVGTVLLASAASGTLVPPPAQPMYKSKLHRYELDNHGSTTQISKAAYQHGSVAGGHLFIFVACIFLIIALPLHLNNWQPRRQPADHAK